MALCSTILDSMIETNQNMLCTGWLDDGVSDDKPDLSRLSEVVSGLGLHEHLCIIYETQEEQFATALPFLSAGLERHEKCLCIAHETMAAAFLEGLRKRGIDVDQ